MFLNAFIAAIIFINSRLLIIGPELYFSGLIIEISLNFYTILHFLPLILISDSKLSLTILFLGYWFALLVILQFFRIFLISANIRTPVIESDAIAENLERVSIYWFQVSERQMASFVVWQQDLVVAPFLHDLGDAGRAKQCATYFALLNGLHGYGHAHLAFKNLTVEFDSIYDLICVNLRYFDLVEYKFHLNINILLADDERGLLRHLTIFYHL